MANEPMRPLVIRVPENIQRGLSDLSRVKSTSLADQMREAISLYVFQRILDPDLGKLIEDAEGRLHRRFANSFSLTPTPATPTPTPAIPDGVQMSLRLDLVQLDRLESLGLVDDNSLADQMRRAFREYLERMEEDPLVQASIAHIRAAEPSMEVSPRVSSIRLPKVDGSHSAKADDAETDREVLRDLDPAL